MMILNDTPIKLYFSVNAVCALERECGCPLHEIMRTDVSCVRDLIWCGLMETEKITRKEAGDLLQSHLKGGGSLQEVAECLADELLRAGFFT